MTNNSHEILARENQVKPPSERSFAVVFAVVFLVVALLPLIGGQPSRLWSFGVAAGFLAAGYFVPAVLAPLNRLWFRFGLLLHKIMSPIFIGAIFGLAVVPTALVMRLFGIRPMPLTFEREKPSYWILRDPAAQAPDSMKRPF